MTKDNSRDVANIKNIGFCCLAVFLIFVCFINARNQNLVAVTDSDKSEVKTETEKTNQPAASKSGLKVTFDETTPGVVYIESNGEKIRIDTNSRQVAQLTAPDETPAETPKQTETAKVETKTDKKTPPVKQDDDDEESLYDFDEGEEPFDYRIVNVPTPKKVPKGTWNLFFSHRFTQPVHPLDESAKNLLGLDSFSVSSFGVTYGITDKLYVSASRSPRCQKGLCRTIEVISVITGSRRTRIRRSA